MDDSAEQERRDRRLASLRSLRASMQGRPLPDEPGDKPIRINRFLALAGFGSRRSVEEFVLAGRVRIGKERAGLDTRVAPGDLVFVDDRLVLPPRSALYVAFHKPPGYLVSRRSQGGAPTIYSLLPENLQDLNYAGRLDLFSRGLLLLSQDGYFNQAITHPTFRLLKKYRVGLDRLPDEKLMRRKFERGIQDEGEDLQAVAVSVLDRRKKIVEVVLSQGKKRQIRRMFEHLGARVMDLFRVSIGNLDVEKIGLAEGKFIAIEPAAIFSGVDWTQGAGFVSLSDPEAPDS